MSVLNRILGASQLVDSIGNAVKSTSEVFRANETEAMKLESARFQNVQDQYAKEFSYAPEGAFGRFVNGLNRLPRPLLAFGTVGLFAYSMIDPAGFSERMIGLSVVPEPMWWLLGAIVGFYFGARELHYYRGGRGSLNIAQVDKNKFSLKNEPTQSPTTISYEKGIKQINSKNAAVKAWLETLS